MDMIGKFDADVRKAVKHGGGAREMAELFVNTAPDLGDLGPTIADMWLKNQASNDPDIGWLAEALAFLLGTELADASNGEPRISADDWAEIRDAVTAEAEDLPLETLEAMMQAFVAKGLV
jgi:hypothetical protein